MFRGGVDDGVGPDFRDLVAVLSVRLELAAPDPVLVEQPRGLGAGRVKVKALDHADLIAATRPEKESGGSVPASIDPGKVAGPARAFQFLAEPDLAADLTAGKSVLMYV